jgi:hypothetical protein
LTRASIGAFGDVVHSFVQRGRVVRALVPAHIARCAPAPACVTAA